MNYFEYFIKLCGLCGLVTVLFSFMAQLIKVYKMKSGEGVSTPFLFLNIFGACLSITHGIYYGLYEIWVPLVLCICVNLTTFTLKVKYHTNDIDEVTINIPDATNTVVVIEE
jgi:uncharacterized protein with PQ loop repeat